MSGQWLFFLESPHVSLAVGLSFFKGWISFLREGSSIPYLGISPYLLQFWSQEGAEDGLSPLSVSKPSFNSLMSGPGPSTTSSSMPGNHESPLWFKFLAFLGGGVHWLPEWVDWGPGSLSSPPTDLRTHFSLVLLHFPAFHCACASGPGGALLGVRVNLLSS